MRKHGVAGIAGMLSLLEVQLGEEIGIDRRLERLVDADPSALALIMGQPR
jgi:hypothetical protein